MIKCDGTLWNMMKHNKLISNITKYSKIQQNLWNKIIILWNNQNTIKHIYTFFNFMIFLIFHNIFITYVNILYTNSIISNFVTFRNIYTFCDFFTYDSFLLTSIFVVNLENYSISIDCYSFPRTKFNHPSLKKKKKKKCIPNFSIHRETITLGTHHHISWHFTTLSDTQHAQSKIQSNKI